MFLSRRQFLHHGSTALVAAAVPLSSGWALGLDARHAADYVRAAAWPQDDPAVRALIASALDAARSAGANYADVRHLVVVNEAMGWRPPGMEAPALRWSIGIGVRALYNGYWGYAAMKVGVLTPDVAARVAREAVAQAKTGAKGPPREVILAAAPVVSNGSWTTPIEIDPFTVSWAEKRDVINAFMAYYGQQPFDASGGTNGIGFRRTVQTFGSSEGTFYTQTLYRTGMTWSVSAKTHWRTHRFGSRLGDSVVSSAGAGWEYLLNAPLEQSAARLIHQASEARFAIPVNVGRFDVVFDGAALASIADATIGTSTELDRAMGYTANTEGTSFLNDPLGMVGEYRIGSSALTVTANRSMRGGCATVAWDDEGVVPDEIPLVTAGILTDFQTTRESASWLTPYYQRRGIPVRSHGGALCTDTEGAPTQAAHNLVVAPATTDTSFEALCSGVKDGLAILSAYTGVDQQALNGTIRGNIVYEIKSGKLGRVVDGATLLFRAPEFWKNLVAVGGASTVCTIGMASRARRASGGQERAHTVSAPAALVKQVAVSTNRPRVL